MHWINHSILPQLSAAHRSLKLMLMEDLRFAYKPRLEVQYCITVYMSYFSLFYADNELSLFNIDLQISPAIITHSNVPFGFSLYIILKVHICISSYVSFADSIDNIDEKVKKFFEGSAVKKFKPEVKQQQYEQLRKVWTVPPVHLPLILSLIPAIGFDKAKFKIQLLCSSYLKVSEFSCYEMLWFLVYLNY